MSRPIVIYRLGSLGDTVVSLPCFHQIARVYADARRILLTNIPVASNAAAVSAVLAGSGLVQDQLAYPLATRSPRRLATLARQLRGTGADTLIYLTEARGLASAWRDVVFFRLCGFRHIIGAPLSADLQACRHDVDDSLEPEAARLARCLADLGAIDLAAPGNWDLRLTADERSAAALLLAPLAGRQLLAINMGGKVAANDWGVANWQSLLAALTALRPDAGLLLVGAAEDQPRGRQVSAIWRGPVVDACGRLTVRESSAALGQADLFIGHDSGPLHLAAISGCRWLGLFSGNNPPKRWHPQTGHGQVIQDMTGMAAILPAMVVDQARRLGWVP